MAAPRLSVVVATYDRPQLLLRLLCQLRRQTLAPGTFEVVVVDDGSQEPVAPLLAQRTWPFALRVLTQVNAGAAAARDAGAREAQGEVLVLVDDDMQVGADFLAQHLSRHGVGERLAVLGRMLPDPDLRRMPLFERWHAYLLDRLAGQLVSGAQPARGHHLFTGNVSLRREDYLAVGGFDRTLGHSEDVELGLRLEASGVRFVFSPEAASLHGSDHTSLEKWRARAVKYGRFDLRISRKHPLLAQASPWRLLGEVHPLARPLLLLAVVAPALGGLLARLAMWVSLRVDRAGAERLAFAGTSVSYNLEYFRGLRAELGGLAAVRADLRRFRALPPPPPPPAPAVATPSPEGPAPLFTPLPRTPGPQQGDARA